MASPRTPAQDSYAGLGSGLDVRLPASSALSTSVAAEETRTIHAVVFALIPEYDQVKVRDNDGHIFTLTRMTTGIDLHSLQVGQQVRCTVTRKLPRVLSAQAIA